MQDSGVYTIDTLPLNPTVKYRLRIHTKDGKEYLSDYCPFQSTPPIDSVNWAVAGDNLEIYTNTHDPSHQNHYYQWDYEETWEYFTTMVSVWKYQSPPPEVVPRPPDEQINTCWGDRVSTSIILQSTAQLSEDLIFHKLLTKVVGQSLDLSSRFTILVHQYALSEDAYNYQTLMQKNSESLGSIFDAQPSNLQSNIYNTTNPSDRVIGYVSVGKARQQRIWIARSQLPYEWYYSYTCEIPSFRVRLDSIAFYFAPGRGYTPINEYYNDLGKLTGYWGNETICVDCRTQGGKNKKPSFWPN